MTRPLHLKNGQVWDERDHRGGDIYRRDLYTAQGRIVESLPHGALEVDLEGYTVFPGLINSHDHLELNHYPRTKFRDVYNNAHEWGEDVNARLNDEPFKTLRAYPLWDKVFIGGLKNLLCGATTVVHHGSSHKPMFRKDFPVRVLQKYGWAHSLHFSTEEEIVRSYRSTPKDVPWFIHLAEGTDEIAAGEYQRLKKLGCVGKNTVIVHGVGLMHPEYNVTFADAPLARGLVWCPSTNIYLLNRTANTFRWVSGGGGIGLGSDSRLTAAGDLLGENKTIFETTGHYMPVELVTTRPAKVIGRSDTGNLQHDSVADIVITSTISEPRRQGFSAVRRAALDMVVKDGIPRIGSPELMAKFPYIETVSVILDGVEKRIHIDLARQIHRCQLKEPGLEIDVLPKNRFWLF